LRCWLKHASTACNFVHSRHDAILLTARDPVIGVTSHIIGE